MIITNIGNVLSALKTALKAEDYVDINNAIYSPSLSYETVIRDYRGTKQSGIETANNPDLPLLAFNRSALRRDIDTSFRSSRTGYMTGSTSGVASPFATFRGEFDFRFKFFANNITDIEAFELAYLANTLDKTVTVTYSDAQLSGDWEYTVDWLNELDDLEIEERDNYVHSVGGTAKVAGNFIIFDTNNTDSQKLIETIDLDFDIYYDNYAELLADKIAAHNA